MGKPVAVVLDGDDVRRRVLGQILHVCGVEAVVASDLTDLVRLLRLRRPRLVVVGATRFDAVDGLEAAHAVRRGHDSLPIVLITTHSSEDLAIGALRAGVTDYFREPLSAAELTSRIERCLAGPSPGADAAPGDGEAAAAAEPRLIGTSVAMRSIRRYVEKVAASDSNVLITGETGTGKELIAELIHGRSRRRGRAFVAINCAALPETLVESELFGHERGAFTGAHAARAGALQQADGGTAFFDEIGDMSLHTQAKVLRAIENREIRPVGGRGSAGVNVRIVAATNYDVERAVADGRFRADLYFRLNVARIELPALRDRASDIPTLLDHYVGLFNTRLGVAVDGVGAEAMACLVDYDWPGNVRELKNVVESIFVTKISGPITLADLPAWLRARVTVGAAEPAAERDRVLSALRASNWNKSRAAARLHWSRMTLYRKLTKYRIVRSTDSTALTHG